MPSGGSGCGVNFGSFVLEFIFKLFLSVEFYGCLASRSLLRDHADSSAVDQFLSCTPDGPLSVLPPSFGIRWQAYSLSSSGCFDLSALAFWSKFEKATGLFETEGFRR